MDNKTTGIDMGKNVDNVTQKSIAQLIFQIRGQKVMLDRNLAELYEVETAQLKRAVRRNIYPVK